MKKVTTKITRKTPSSQSITSSVATTAMRNARGQQISRLTGPSSSQQPQKSRNITSKTSAKSITSDGRQRTRTEESFTTISQMPLPQATGLTPRQQQQQRTTYTGQQQQRQQVQDQQAQQARTGIPRMQIPRELPREIASLAEQQYMQLMETPSLPPPQLQRQQIPQGGGQRRQVQAQPQQFQERQRQIQQPQRQMQQPQRQMQQPQSQMQQPQRQMQQPQSQMQQPQRQMQQPQCQMQQPQSQMQQPQRQMQQPQRQMQQPQSQMQQPQRQMQQPQQVQERQRQIQQPQQVQERQRQMQQPQRQQVQERQRQMQQPQPQQVQERQRQMQQPQAENRSRMQQPGFQSRMQQPRTGLAPPTRVIATAAPPGLLEQVTAVPPRQAQPVSPRTTEFEMIEALSPETMEEYMSLEQCDFRPRRPQAQATNILATADAQYQQLLSPEQQAPRRLTPVVQPASPRTREFETIEALSPETMEEYMALEQCEYRPCRPQAQPTHISAAAAQYQQLLSPEEQAARRLPPVVQPRPRRMMQQPGFAAGVPRQISATADDQYRQLLSPEQVRQPSPKASPPKSPQSIPTAAVGQPTSLEVDVEQALMRTSKSKPGTPLKATGEIQRLPTRQESPTIAMVQTPTGLKQAETQLLLEATVKRTPTEEIVTRHVVAIEGGMVDERETVQLSPGKGMKKPKTPESMELIICSSEVKMAAGYRETTTSVVYETTDEPPTSAASKSPNIPKNLTPTILSRLILEESADVDKTIKLHAPDLKHSSVLTYNIKKRVTALQLNKQDVEELEKSITWPSPRADQTQDDPQPELLASMMHTEEKGMAMGAPPEYLYSALFGTDEPMQVEQGTVGVNSVAAHPLNDVVIPAAPAPRDLHIVGMTMELANAAVNAQNDGMDNESVKPSDGAYAERVLGDNKEAMEHVKAKNVAHRDGPPVKYPAFFDMDKLAPWEVDQIDAVIKQIGAIPTSILEATVVAPSAVEAADELRDFSVDGIEYLLNMDKVMHHSNVQLRGTQPPSWFPGYYLALGAFGGNSLSLARSPSMVLQAAYNAVQPDLYNDDSIMSV